LTPNDACGPTGPLGERMTRTRTPLAHVLNAAVHHLKSYVERRTPLPSGLTPRWAPSPAWVERDERRNAQGGIQLAAMAAPTARADGLECGNIGVWEPFTTEQLKTLYPTHADYVARVRQAVAANITAGFILPEDGAETIADAQASVVGTGLACGTYCGDRGHYRVDFASTGTLRHTTGYYNIVGGRALLAAVDAAHRHVAEGDSADVAKRAEFYAVARHRLRDYLALLDEARREGRVTTTAADVLSMQAHTIIAGLAGPAAGTK
jgi:Alpha/beta hydrolase domain